MIARTQVHLDQDSGVRLDAWLWAARFYRTRAVAKQAIEKGRIEFDGAACKPSKFVHLGARLRVRRGEECFDVEVLGLSGKRGSGAAAQMLYRESDASRARRDAAGAQRRAERAGYRAPSGKPDKRARRLIRALDDIDSR